MTKLKRWMALGLLACACGGSSTPNPTPDSGTPTGSGSLTGSVNGATLTVRDAVFGITPGSLNVNVVVGDRTGLCSLLTATTIPGPTTVFGFGLINLVAAAPPVNLAPADVSIGNYAYFSLFNLTTIPGVGKWWDGAFAVATDCNPNGIFATGGTVSVTQVGTTSTSFKATLNSLTFPDGGTLSGNVEAVYCAALQSQNPPCGGISLLARTPVFE